MNILVTLNSGYIKPLCAMLRSLLDTHPDVVLEIYVINKSLTEKDYAFLYSNLEGTNYNIHDIKICDDMLSGAPVSSRYPCEMYYRIFAADFLPPDVDKILYLDPDLIVLKNLEKLYSTDLGDCYFAAASHVNRPLQKLNEIRLQMDKKGPYINSGVMLMNIRLLRTQQDCSKVFEYIEKNKNILFLPDQDIISAVYSDKIIAIDPYIYNMTERMLFSPRSIKNDIDAQWVKENSAIVHYCGRNKPWKASYSGLLGGFYHQYADGMDKNI
ncbi:MAG: glycosyltransferase family 8 protein [Oscillospiraceae bacterium]|nr:glycosyltransferase family 8 protein [Oscillospiraceae bacterium]